MRTVRQTPTLNHADGKSLPLESAGLHVCSAMTSVTSALRAFREFPHGLSPTYRRQWRLCDAVAVRGNVPMSFRAVMPFLAVTLVTALTSACGWVDATGRQSDDDGAGQTNLSVGVPVPLVDRSRLVLAESVEQVVFLDGDDARLDNWTWREADHADDRDVRVDTCAGVDGFDPALAVGRLDQACNGDDDCTLNVDEFKQNGSTGFRVRLPGLRTPFAARYLLSTTMPDGNRTEREQIVCGLAINEAPIAGDDRYAVGAKETLDVVGGTDGDLLANDEDDDDVRNAPLTIDAQVARAPRHADFFELATDGGFRYTPAADIAFNASGRLEDSFAYTLSDGLHTTEGQVIIIIADNNGGPEVSDPVPQLRIEIPDNLAVSIEFDYARYFSDPDGDTLKFEIPPGSLPPSGRLVLDETGTLRGAVTIEDVGNWQAELQVSDSRETLVQPIQFTIVGAVTGNRPPTAVDITNQRVSGRFSYDVSGFFDDPDGDRLRFSAVGLPDNVSIDKNGVISGRARDRNEGRWFVIVLAEDGNGGQVSEGFRLIIDD